AGGQTHAVAVHSATWEDLPLFVRDGAILPLQPVMNYVGEAPVTNLDWLMLPSTARTSFVYYDDDGETYGYETGAYHRQEIALRDTGESIEVDFSVPEGTWMPQTDFFYAWVRCATNHGARLDGMELVPATDEAALRATASPGWTHATNQFGYAALVKVPAGVAQNLVLSNHLAAMPRFSPGAGTYSGLVVVEMSCATAGAEVRYTLDGSDPGEASTLYQTPVPLAASAEIRARAYAEGRDPSAVASGSYGVDAGRLNNPGFELQAGTNTEAALSWETGRPDVHGERWGTAARVAWRPRSGSWHGTVRGTWLGIGETSGGFWQEVEALPGQTYTFGAWCWADHTWSAGRQGVKLEFLDGAGGGETVLLARTNSTADVGESWEWKAVSATAPSNATWVRGVVFADSVGPAGALQFDDVSLEGPAQHVVTVASAHGSPMPAVGYHVVNSGTVVTGSVASPVSGGLVEYVCTGWMLEGNEPVSGSSNRVEVTVTNTARLTWLWTTHSLVPSAIEFATAATAAVESAGSVWIGLVRDTTNAAASVRVTTSNGTAMAGSDYLALSTRVEFAAGVATAAVELVLLDDALHEPDKTLTLRLSEPGGAGVLGTRSKSVFTILDNDEPLPDRTLTVASAHGSCEPAVGSQVYPNGTVVSCVATGILTAGATQRVCAGWSGTGVVPTVGSSTAIPVFALTADSSLEWIWKTNVWLALSADPGGTVSGGESGWMPLGSNLLLTAAAEDGHAFSGWSGDVPAGQEQSNPLAVATDRSRTIHAGFSVDAGVNLLQNPGFEEAGAGSGMAAYWAAGDPDGHGETWGSAIRINWDSHDGNWVQALRGTWAGEGHAAGIWQESAARPGEAYRFTAWFWADDGHPYGPWQASARALKLEFLDGETGGDTLLLAVTNSLAELDQTWRSYSVEAVAPSNAAWVRVVIMAEGMSADGSLRADDLTLEWLRQLDAPVALPATDEAGDSFTARWQVVSDATGYRLDVAGSADFAADTYAEDLFISEYAEGLGFDRYVEIYNGTGAAVDLSVYRLGMIDNGGAWYERVMALTGTLAHGATHVIRHPEASNAWVLAAADQTAPANGPLDFAGDDAVGLARVTGSFTNLLDAVGEEGEDPGSGWGVSGVADATRNHTLIRLASVRSGNPDWAGCSNEWTVLANNTFTNAGEHVMEGGEAGTFVPGYRNRPCAGVSQSVTGLVAGATYYYRVWATNAAAVSGYSSVVEVPTYVRHDVVALAKGRGSIAPSGAVSVVAGTTREFAIQAHEFHHIESVRADGAALPVTNETWMTVLWGPAVAPGQVSAVFAETRALQDTPHWWLDAWYPGQTNFDDLAVSDKDDDGHLAWQEYVADTDPTDSGDGLRVVPDAEVAGAAVRFLSSTNRHYTLMSAPGLDEGSWHPVPGAGPRRGIGGLDRLADSNVPPRGWIYTIQVDLP
ncbi:MAG: chitobiase/beta-hexosaminidase C-terminal domain-containing protein, partial [Kiritimatiellae bacterium]|nr:chitobiase/beta-hexosaminidase C-terminal domain-containing protein [Kiritimatiellia bacterium]